MFAFKKKNTDDQERDYSEELDNSKPIKKTRRRKKAEQPKPWGKIERIIVFIFLLGIPILSIIFLTHAKDSKISISNPIQQSPKDINQLKRQLVDETQNLTGTYGIWVQAVDNSYSIGVNENNSFEGASLFKLPLMIAYYENVDTGKIDPSTNYTLRYSDQETGAGAISSLPAGSVITYSDIIDAMGKNSDNTAFSIIDNVLSSDSEVNVINQIEMKNTDFKNSLTTPYDIGLLFYKLTNSNLISNNSKNELFRSLTDTDFENLIPNNLPDNVRIVHKYGAVDDELNDAGIVYTNRPFILVILSKAANHDEAQVEIPRISQIVYDWAK